MHGLNLSCVISLFAAAAGTLFTPDEEGIANLFKQRKILSILFIQFQHFCTKVKDFRIAVLPSYSLEQTKGTDRFGNIFGGKQLFQRFPLFELISNFRKNRRVIFT